MIYTLTACTADNRALVVSQTRTTCPVIRTVVAAELRARGLIVFESQDPA